MIINADAEAAAQTGRSQRIGNYTLIWSGL